MPRGVPSSRMLSVSRTMLIELQQDHRGDEQREHGVDPALPVKRMAAPPTMTAAVESVSPSMCRKTLRMLTSPEKRHSRAATVPFMMTPASATIHHQPGLHLDRHAETVDGGNSDPAGEHDQCGGVDEGGEYAGALVTKGLLVVGRARLEVDGHVREHDASRSERLCPASEISASECALSPKTKVART